MKTAHWIMPLFVACTVFTAPAGMIVLPIRDSVAVYQNETRRFLETPLFKASLEDRLLVIKNGEEHYLVKNRDGRQGWIEKALCVRVQPSKSIYFDPIDLVALTVPVGPIYIEGKADQLDNKIFIDRSFNGELMSNLDRDEMVKRTGE
jgi:hypothetical protein